MANGIDTTLSNTLNSYVYGGASSSTNTSSLTNTYDYKKAQADTSALLKGYGSNATSVASLKSDSAAFLTSYTQSMNTLYGSAGTLSGGGINDVLYDKNGEITEDTIKKTVDAVQTMIDDYNDSLTLLNKNADRGSGVENQIRRMSDNPIAQQKLDMIGVSVGKDATLKLDTEALTKSLTEAADIAKNNSSLSGRLNLLKDVLAGSNGLAGSIQKDARSGLSESSAKLIGNDIAEIKQQQDSSMTSLMGFNMQSGTLNRAGAYFLSNQAAVGLMMNMLV